MTDIIETGAAGASDSEPNQASIAMADLPQALREAALRLNWTELMPVQAQAIPPMLSGEDVMVQSQTGSGKTGAFLLPMLHRIDPALGAPQALVLAPTRELAVQVARDAEELGRSMGIRSLPIYGGVGYAAQIQGLEAGAQLIIGTPGRILDHLLKGTLTLDWLKMLVFDEADRMLSMGFYPDMKQLQRYLPRGLQSAMFSATYPGHVKRLAQQFLREPRFVSLSQTQVHATDVLHVVYKVPAMQKSRVLVKIIEQENPASAIIFCNTKADVHFVSVVLRRFGYDVGEISADLSQAAREEVLEKLRLNRLKFLVATDVAARGIDIHELSHVFQYQPPQDHEAYVHRTGRTGRAGAAGMAISLVSGMEELELEQIAKKFSIPLEERQVPTDEELETLISQRAVFLLEAHLREADNIQKERLQRFTRIAADLAGNEDSLTLLAMLVDEFYQKTFHAPLAQPSEKLLPLAHPGQAPAEKTEGEKRKRKRRKKNGSTTEHGDQQAGRPDTPQDTPAEPRVADAPVPADTGESSDCSPAAPDAVDTAEQGAGSDSALQPVPEQPENPDEQAVPKKRRRRRSRKPKADAVQADGMTSPEQPEAGEASITAEPADAGGKDQASGNASARPAVLAKDETPVSRSGRHSRSGSRKEPRREAPKSGEEAAPKPKKKIFLE
ncbi:DEAD/DEAH box helicase [Desulfomicrobium orale]|uniref:DEAD/DEAH box helicase n=1 Tax=Desulfomicrobium orale TaxID=132132 RepID=UPI0009FB0A87|nr:DEAD/DEAH box helicase [Desulfomicrobium orale]